MNTALDDLVEGAYVQVQFLCLCFDAGLDICGAAIDGRMPAGIWWFHVVSINWGFFKMVGLFPWENPMKMDDWVDFWQSSSQSSKSLRLNMVHLLRGFSCSSCDHKFRSYVSSPKGMEESPP